MALGVVALDPVAFSIAGFAIRWYALSYLVGIGLGCFLFGWLDKLYQYLNASPALREDFFTYLALGVIVGGRLGYVLFYNPSYYLHHPLRVLYLWEGGMASHGGILGVVLAMWYTSHKYRVSFRKMWDLASVAGPVSFFFGRLANFVNGELYGIPSDVPWAFIFPNAGMVPRHPTQLYEAILEGAFLFCVMFLLFSNSAVRRYKGLTGASCCLIYAICRIWVECYRMPDSHIGYIFDVFTLGQLLSLPILVVGCLYMFYVLKYRHCAFEKQ